MPIDIRTYLELEVGLTKHLLSAWQEYAAPQLQQITDACEKEDWATAKELVSNLSLAPVGAQNKEFIKYTMLNMMVFGGTLTDAKEVEFLKNPEHLEVLNKAVNTFLLYLIYDGTQQMQDDILQSIAILEHGEVVQKKYNPQEPRDNDGEWTLEERQIAAKITYNKATKEKQALANQAEIDFSKGVGIPRTADNSAFDLLAPGIGVEVKTLIDRKRDEITMHPESLLRKKKEARKKKLNTYTVVLDERPGKKQIYWKAGVGSFALASMNKASSVAELKKVLVAK